MPEHQNFRTALAGFNREDVVRYIEYLNTAHAAEIAQLNSELEYLRSRVQEIPEAEIAAEPAEQDEGILDTFPKVGEQVAQVRELLDSWKQNSNFQEALMAAADTLKAEAEENGEELEQLKESLSEREEEIEALKVEMEEKNTEIEVLKADADSKNAEIEALKTELEEKSAQIRDLQAAAEAKHAQLLSRNSEIEQLRSCQAANAGLMEKELETYRRAERVERKARERAELVYHRVNGTLSDATVKVEDAAKLIGEMTERVTAQLKELQTAVTGSKAALYDAAETMVALRPEPEED